MKLYLILMIATLFTTTCGTNTSANENTNTSANVNTNISENTNTNTNTNTVPKTETNTSADSEPFTLKKNESKQVGNFTIKMLSVGHTISESGHKFFANLEISENGKISKPTIYVSKEIPLGNKYLKLVAISEKADVKLSDPFLATSCTLVVNDKPNSQPTPTPTVSTVKPTLAKVKYAQIRLGFGKKTAVVDLDETADVTLGGESTHRYKVYFATVKDNKIYYLFHVQSGPALSNPMGPCGGDSPQTLVWLKTDFNLKVEEAKSEVFASCAYNGGRYLQGKIQTTFSTLKLVFEQQKTKTEINYDNSMPENGFEVKEIK